MDENMDSTKNISNTPILLIYYNFRGIGQMIRYLLCYIQIPYVDILIDEYQTQKLTLPSDVLAVLRSKKINRNDLPALIHDNRVVYQLNQVMNYICFISGREDLLGVDIYQKARVCEIQELYSVKLANNIKLLSSIIAEFNQTPQQGEEFLQILENKLVDFFDKAGYFKELGFYLLQQQEQRFVFGNLTVIDFYFIETSRFSVSIFGNISNRLSRGKWVQPSENYKKRKAQQGQIIQYEKNLIAMSEFISFFSSQPFYTNNKQYLQSFKFFPKTVSGEQKNGMQKIQATYFVDTYYDSN